MADIGKSVRKIFNIPDWYIMSDTEVKRLFRYILESTCPQEARLFRFLDCSAFCTVDTCYFCKFNIYLTE